MKRITETFEEETLFSLLSNKKTRISKPKNINKYTKRDEERMLKFALKQSEIEYKEQKEKSSNRDLNYSSIPPCKTVIATESDFANPIQFFESIWEKNQNSTGIIKIVPPESWRSNYNGYFKNYLKKFEESDKKLETRKMNLNKLYMAKKFEYSKTYNFKEYKEQARTIANRMYSNFNEMTLDKIEEDYWKKCFETEGFPIFKLDNIQNEIEYAADVPLKKYLSNQELNSLALGNTGKKWNLLSLNMQKNSLFQFIKDDPETQISGVTIPWFYFGMLYSTFCWHTEDLYLYSINFLHEGKPKVWYSVPHNQKEKMDIFIKNKYYAILLKQPDLVHYLTVFIDPLELIRNGIEVYKAIQNPGEIIITLPEGYHAGFNAGFNIAEAVNFSTLKWLEYGFKALTDYKKCKFKIPVFSLEWLIFENLTNLHKLEFDKTHHINEFKIYLKKIITEEIEKRRQIELNFIANLYNFKIEEIDELAKYDENECPVCRNYCFMSYTFCQNCKKNSCISHLIQCQCLPTDLILRYRFKDNLETLLSKM